MRTTLVLSILLALAGCKKPFDRDDFNPVCDGKGLESAAATATGTTSVVKAYGSHYVLSVREAKTARVVATKTVDVKVEHCPILVLGNTAADRSKDYVEISEDALAAFLAPHLPKAASARLLAARPEREL